MQNNYDRLFQELSELVTDTQIYKSLDEPLKNRVQKLLGSNTIMRSSETIKQLSCNDTQTLFTKNNQSQDWHYSQNTVLKDTTNQKRKSTLNTTGKITYSKIQTSDFDSSKKGQRNSKSKQRLSKEKNKQTIRYNIQTSKSKSNSRDNFRKSLIECPSKKKISHAGESSIQRNINNVNMNDRYSKYFKGNEQKKNKKEPTIKKYQSDENVTLFQQKLKSNLCQSRQILKRLATIQLKPSRKSVSGSKNKNMKQKKICKIPQEQLTLMQAIYSKLDILAAEKKEYESQIKTFQQMIARQKQRIEGISLNISKISNQINKNSHYQQGYSQQIKISRKKSEHFICESKQIQNRIMEVNKSKDTIFAGIEQEKYLINMYMTVIEQIKNQLKIEQSQKIELIKKLVVIKNSEKMSMEKYLYKEATSDQIFRGMSQSMKKWV